MVHRLSDSLKDMAKIKVWPFQESAQLYRLYCSGRVIWLGYDIKNPMGNRVQVDDTIARAKDTMSSVQTCVHMSNQGNFKRFFA